MFRSRPRPNDGDALFAEERVKRAEFARRAGDALAEIAREAEALNLPLLAQFATMARLETDAIRAADQPRAAPK